MSTDQFVRTVLVDGAVAAGDLVVFENTVGAFAPGPQKVISGGVPSGTGNVVGPVGATDGHLAVFDGVTGLKIKDGGAPSGGITQLTSDVTAGPGSGSQAATIAAHAVVNSKLAQMGAHTYKGNNTAGSADPADVSAAQLTADLTFGTIAGTAAQGNDARLSDARVPTAHEASHLAAGTDPLSGLSPSQVTGTAVVTADSRLSDARTPTTHESSHLAAGSDPLAGLSPSQVTGTAVVTADSRLSDARTPTSHASTHQAAGGDLLNVASLAGQLAEQQGYGAYVRDYIDLAEPGAWEIPAAGFLEIDETDGPNALLSYSVRVHPYSDQCLAENSGFQVLDDYDITEPYALEIPASALMEIAETSGARDFDIS